MEEELTGFMELTVPVVGDIAVVSKALCALDSDKHPVEMDEEERKELAVLFVTKGGMSGAAKKAKELEDRTKEVGSPWMLARGIKSVKVPGVGTMSVTEGSNVSISQDRLREVLINYLPAKKVAEVIEKVVKRTPYVALQFLPEKAK